MRPVRRRTGTVLRRDQMTRTVNVRDSEESIVTDEQHVVPDRHHMRPVRRRARAVLRRDQMPRAVNVGYSEESIVANEQYVCHVIPLVGWYFESRPEQPAHGRWFWNWN